MEPQLVLEILLKPRPNTDCLSGRVEGVRLALSHKIVEHLKQGDVLRLVIDPKLRAINDTFFKGLFNEALHYLLPSQLLCQLQLPPKYMLLVTKVLHIETHYIR